MLLEFTIDGGSMQNSTYPVVLREFFAYALSKREQPE
jgi:hypothetical protein